MSSEKRLQLKLDPNQDYQFEAVASVMELFEGLLASMIPIHPNSA